MGGEKNITQRYYYPSVFLESMKKTPQNFTILSDTRRKVYSLHLIGVFGKRNYVTC
jgi:hypothetical protein